MTAKARAVPADHPLRGSRTGTPGTGTARITKPPISRHPFQADPQLGKDAAGKYEICMCSLPRENSVHRLPDRHPDEVAHEQRRVGER